jgi:hypothetical protein
VTERPNAFSVFVFRLSNGDTVAVNYKRIAAVGANVAKINSLWLSVLFLLLP